MAIRILVTGGTFDKEYNERTGQLYFKDTHLGEMLRRGRSRVEVTIRTVMMVDSLDMTNADRALIVQNCQQAQEDRIVITHGTDTMTETAAAVARVVSGKTVVLTGAMIPWAFGTDAQKKGLHLESYTLEPAASQATENVVVASLLAHGTLGRQGGPWQI